MILSFIFILLGGWFARMNGGAKPRTNKQIERLLCISFFVYLAYSVSNDFYFLVSILGILGLAVGHGQYFMDLVARSFSPESVDIINRMIFGKDPRTSNEYKKYRDDKWFKFSLKEQQKISKQINQDIDIYGRKKLYYRNAFGMFLTGTLVGLPTGLYLLFNNYYLIGIIISMTGIVKSISYMIGQFGKDKKIMNITESLKWGTAISEFINGSLRTSLVFICLYLIGTHYV